MGLPVQIKIQAGQCAAKILDDLTQKPTKLIRTELVKMTSEASWLPTDLRAIAGNTSRIKIFLILCIQFVLCMDCRFMK